MTEASNLAQQLIDGAKREGVDQYTATLLLHASSLIDRQAAALNRYRYAVAFAGADAWDNGRDIRERFSWARMVDPVQLSDDCIAKLGSEFLDHR